VGIGARGAIQLSVNVNCQELPLRRSKSLNKWIQRVSNDHVDLYKNEDDSLTDVH
jgi:hypothetical protein